MARARRRHHRRLAAEGVCRPVEPSAECPASAFPVEGEVKALHGRMIGGQAAAPAAIKGAARTIGRQDETAVDHADVDRLRARVADAGRDEAPGHRLVPGGAIRAEGKIEAGGKRRTADQSRMRMAGKRFADCVAAIGIGEHDDAEPAVRSTSMKLEWPIMPPPWLRHRWPPVVSTLMP